MNSTPVFPTFDDCFPELNQFILELADAYRARKIGSWDALEEKVHAYFTAQKLDDMEAWVPGWRNMAAQINGVTLTHIMCVFLGLVMLPEFQALSETQQQLAKWIVLFHDVEKELKGAGGEKDRTHAFRSAVLAARQLPRLGFEVTGEYDRLIDTWSELTYSATRNSPSFREPIQDNGKLPEILLGLEQMFGEDMPATLAVKCILFHMSINVVNDWPQAAPLMEEEIKRYITGRLVPLLKVMMLSDNEGWVMFSEERQQQRTETLEAFQRIEQLISM
jgi:hypothetical protein